jgi:LysW-gamma-L-alpha-aminoadipyl-6-phosphate/LysW-L-glutamyl-5-phosphate reductase
VTLRAAVSQTFAGRRLDSVHPNLRGVTDLAFTSAEHLPACDVLFLAVDHGRSAQILREHAGNAGLLIDLSADFRLRDAALHGRYYDVSREPGIIETFTTGWPETQREALRTADRISVPGCMAMAGMLALHPLAAANVIETGVTIDARTGSSGSGATAGDHNTHAERSGAMRVFAPSSHRHEAEITQATGLQVQMSATGVEAVRGVQVLCRARAREPVDDVKVRHLYREVYQHEPFVRIVAFRRGTFRYPDPKIQVNGCNRRQVRHRWSRCRRCMR